MKNMDNVEIKKTDITERLSCVRIQKCFDMRFKRCGFTMVELIVVVAILTVLAFIAFPVYGFILNKIKVSRCAADIRSIDTAISAYIIDKNSLPSQLSDIGTIASQRDPWNNLYVYQNLSIAGNPPLEDIFSVQLNTDYDLYSKGKDGASAAAYADPTSGNDIARHNNGTFIGLRDPQSYDN